MATLSRDIAKFVKGRKIVRFTLNPQWDEGSKQYTYDPVITLDNGAQIAFAVQERQDLDYGVAPCIFQPSKENK